MNMKRNRMRPHGGGGGRGFNPPRFQGQGGGRPFHNNAGGGNNPENDRRIRANALKMIEKYQNMAKDALVNGDVVMAENYHQHADHFQRVLNAHAPRFPEQAEAPEQHPTQPQPSFSQEPPVAVDEPPHQPGRFPPDDFYPEPSPKHHHTPRPASAHRIPPPQEDVEALRDVPFLSGASLAPRVSAPEEDIAAPDAPPKASSTEGGIVRRRRTRIPRRPTESSDNPES